MRTALTFLSGVLVGYGCLQLQAQSPSSTKLNHIGVRVSNYEQALRFYRDVMGFREAFSFKRDDGSPAFAYLQVSRETFLEIMAPSPDAPAGLDHIGLEVENLSASQDHLKTSDLQLTNQQPGRAGAPYFTTRGPDGVLLEFLQLGPQSLQRKAVESWK